MQVWGWRFGSSLSLSHSLSLCLSHTHSLSLSQSHVHSHLLFLSPSLSPTQRTTACAFGVGGLGCLYLSQTHSICLSHTLSLSHLPTLLSLSRSLSHTHRGLMRARLGLEVCARKTRLFASAHPTCTCRWTLFGKYRLPIPL